MQENNKKAERSALRRAAAPVAVALILLLAGCAGAGGGGDASPDSPNVTDEDAPTPDTTENTTDETDTTEQIDADFADKFSNDTGKLLMEIDGDELQDAHEEALVNTYESFTVEGEMDWDGQHNWDEGYAIWGAEDANGFIHHERVADAPGEQVWSYFQSIEASEAKRIQTDNGTRTVDDLAPNAESVVGGEKVIRDNLYSANYEFTEYKDDNGTTVAVFEATEPTEWVNEYRLVDTADSVDGELWITENGVVRKSNLTAYSGDEVVWDSEFRVTNINSTETQPPSWAEGYAEEHGYYEN